jgi:hypothetical protein
MLVATGSLGVVSGLNSQTQTTDHLSRPVPSEEAES